MSDRKCLGTLHTLTTTSPWSPTEWTASDDRVRGGSSQSYLTITPGNPTANFNGNLDTKTLGGAGFASQRTTENRSWNLSAYDGIEIDVARSDSKKYTFTIKDEILPLRGDGREQSTISWEFDFVVDIAGVAQNAGQKVYVAFEDLKPTYRGREKDDAKPLDLKNIRRFSLMMRSFFDKQDGDFELVVRSISAVKKRRELYRDDPNARSSSDIVGEKGHADYTKARQGWISWLFGGCAT